jgi:hypothetical protein
MRSAQAPARHARTPRQVFASAGATPPAVRRASSAFLPALRRLVRRGPADKRMHPRPTLRACWLRGLVCAPPRLSRVRRARPAAAPAPAAASRGPAAGCASALGWPRLRTLLGCHWAGIRCVLPHPGCCSRAAFCRRAAAHRGPAPGPPPGCRPRPRRGRPPRGPPQRPRRPAGPAAAPRPGSLPAVKASLGPRSQAPCRGALCCLAPPAAAQQAPRRRTRPPQPSARDCDGRAGRQPLLPARDVSTRSGGPLPRVPEQQKAGALDRHTQRRVPAPARRSVESASAHGRAAGVPARVRAAMQRHQAAQELRVVLRVRRLRPAAPRCPLGTRRPARAPRTGGGRGSLPADGGRARAIGSGPPPRLAGRRSRCLQQLGRPAALPRRRERAGILLITGRECIRISSPLRGAARFHAIRRERSALCWAPGSVTARGALSACVRLHEGGQIRLSGEHVSTPHCQTATEQSRWRACPEQCVGW